MPDADPSIRPALVHAERLEHYSFGEGHPMGPGRVSSALDLSRHLGLLDAFDVVDPPDAADDLLTLVHTPDYLAAIRSGLAAPRYGLGDADNPVTAGLDRVAAGVVGASVEAAVSCGRVRPTARSMSAAAFTTPSLRPPADSACSTTRRWPSAGC